MVRGNSNEYFHISSGNRYETIKNMKCNQGVFCSIKFSSHIACQEMRKKLCFVAFNLSPVLIVTNDGRKLNTYEEG